MIHGLLFLLVSISWAGIIPLPADTIEQIDRNFKEIADNMSNMDLRNGGTIQYMLEVTSDVIITGNLTVTGGIVGVSTQTVWLTDTAAGSTGQCPAGSSVTATVGAYPIEITLFGTCYLYALNSGYSTVGLNVLMDGTYIDAFTSGVYMIHGYSEATAAGANPTGTGEYKKFPCSRSYITKTAVSAAEHKWCLAVVTTASANADAKLLCSTASCSLRVSEFRGTLAP